MPPQCKRRGRVLGTHLVSRLMQMRIRSRTRTAAAFYYIMCECEVIPVAPLQPLPGQYISFHTCRAGVIKAREKEREKPLTPGWLWFDYSRSYPASLVWWCRCWPASPEMASYVGGRGAGGTPHGLLPEYNSIVGAWVLEVSR